MSIALWLALGWASIAHAQDCAGGRVASDATDWHCCWPGQSWDDRERACVGPPECPGALVSHGETCVPRIAPAPAPPPAQTSTAPLITPAPATPPSPTAPPAPLDVRVVPAGAPGWPSSVTAPTADTNPEVVREGGDYGLLRAGITLLAVGWITSAGMSAIPFGQTTYVVTGQSGYLLYTYDSEDSTCLDTVGALQLVPAVGSLMAIVAVAACRVTTYREVRNGRGELVGYASTGDAGLDAQSLAWNIPLAVLQLTGLGLTIGGIAGSHTTLRTESGSASGARAGATWTIEPFARGAQAGLTLHIQM